MGDISKELGLPDILTLRLPNCEPSAYGASKVISDKLGMRKPPLSSSGWEHGWLYYGYENAYLTNTLMEEGQKFRLVATKEHEKFLRQRGFPNSKAVGLPFAYMDPSPNTVRIPGSLLVMPPHTVSYMKVAWNEIEYLEYIRSVSKYFSRIVFCVYRVCADNGRWVNNLEKYGYDFVIGAHPSDWNSLYRMRKLFDSFESMTTNTFGSHMLYAAFCGSKVSVAGPEYRYDPEEFSKGPEACNPAMLAKEKDHLRHCGLDVLAEKFPMFFVEPQNAVEQLEWARNEIGYYDKVSYEELARLLGWNAKDIFFAHVARLKKSFLKRVGKAKALLAD